MRSHVALSLSLSKVLAWGIARHDAAPHSPSGAVCTDWAALHSKSTNLLTLEPFHKGIVSLKPAPLFLQALVAYREAAAHCAGRFSALRSINSKTLELTP